jgi:hypothetical protein
MKRWIYEIIGCLPFFLIGLAGIFAYIDRAGWPILIPSIGLMVIAVFSPIKVYLEGDV